MFSPFSRRQYFLFLCNPGNSNSERLGGTWHHESEESVGQVQDYSTQYTARSILSAGHRCTCSIWAEGQCTLGDAPCRLIEQSGACRGTGSCIAIDELVTALHVAEDEDGLPIPITANGEQLFISAKSKELDIAIMKAKGELLTHSKRLCSALPLKTSSCTLPHRPAVVQTLFL